MGSFPTPVYLCLFCLALRRSVRIFSTSPRSSTSSFDRFRTVRRSTRRAGFARASQRTVDTLVLPFLVHIVEVPEHLNSANMGARIVYHTLATILDEILQQLEGLHIV